MGNGGKVQSIERAIKILECFSERNPELKLTEISDRLDLNKSTVHGIINTMKIAGLIDQNEENQKYRLGLKLVELSSLALKNLDIRQIAKPVLKRLSQDVNETIHLGMLKGSEIIYIDKVESTQSIRIFTTIGTRHNAFCTGIGKSILSTMGEDEVRARYPEVFPKYTDKTITNIDEILKELEKVRVDGYAMDLEENIIGLNCVGAPILNSEGKAIYSISVSGPATRMTPEKLEEISKKVKQAALEISRDIGYKG